MLTRASGAGQAKKMEPAPGMANPERVGAFRSRGTAPPGRGGAFRRRGTASAGVERRPSGQESGVSGRGICRSPQEIGLRAHGVRLWILRPPPTSTGRNTPGCRQASASPTLGSPCRTRSPTLPGFPGRFSPLAGLPAGNVRAQMPAATAIQLREILMILPWIPETAAARRGAAKASGRTAVRRRAER